jgi:hypothetical protein
VTFSAIRRVHQRSDEVRYENRALLDLVKLLPCQNCGADDGTIVPAHSNSSVHGKGAHRKSDDLFHAALCCRCHRWLDQPGGNEMDPTGIWAPVRADREEMFRRSMENTHREYWKRGLVGVTA